VSSTTLERPERLAFKVAGTDVVTDGTAEVREDEGVVTAIVSVTGTVDEVDDIIEPGAYAETLIKRKPKVCWHHSWEQPIGRVLHIEELMPGDTRLPRHTKDGKPWPAEAGALLATMQFNMKSDRGREAFEAVRFYSESGECEWSIGYQVPQGKATRDSKGVRHIKAMDLYELSFVLFGAHMLTGTLGLKDAVALMTEHKSRGHRTITLEQIRAHLDALGLEPGGLTRPAGAGTKALMRALVADSGADPWYLELRVTAESKRKLNTEQRRRKPTLPGSDTAWPIGDREDLRAAIQSFGRAKDDEKDKVKRWIIRRARELGAVNLLPEDWNVTKSSGAGGDTTMDDAIATLSIAEAVRRTATESLRVGGKAGGADRNAGEAEQLRRYWTIGAGGAKIRWGTEGDFTRCVRYLSEHMTPENAKGYCANRHHEMTGMWPGDRDNKALAGKAAPGDTTDPARFEDGPENTGVMVALYPELEDAEKIAVRGGLRPEDLHITLAYLGNIDDDAGQGADITLGGAMDAIMAATQAAASVHQALAGTVGGIGKFPDTGDGVPVWAPVDVVGLGALRESVVTALSEAGLPVKTDHGFTPHMTLGYNLDMSLIPAVEDVSVSFHKVAVVVGDARADIPLGAGPAPTGPAATPPPAAGTKAYEYDPGLEATTSHRPHPDRKEFPHLEGTYEERQALLDAALCEALIPNHDDDENAHRLHLQINGTWPDRVVATVHDFSGPGDDSTTYEVDYRIDPDGEVHLGEPHKVRLTLTTEDDEDVDAGVAELMPLSEMIDTVVNAFKTLPAGEVKAGRVLSADTATRLQMAAQHLIAVLEAAGIHVREAEPSRSAVIEDESTAPSAREGKARHDGSYEVDTAGLSALLSDIDSLTRS
jgi:2'-5' RNA ligase